MAMKKGVRIEGFISMWPREACDITPEGESRLFMHGVPELQGPGVYVLYRDDQPHYIGQAKVIRQRLHAHANQTTDRYYNFWNLFSVFLVKDEKYLDEVETILIASMPTANSATPKLRKIPMPPSLTSQIRLIRKHQADPLTRKDFASLLKISRRIEHAATKGKRKG
jgi:GIY-YIG catalytic domain